MKELTIKKCNGIKVVDSREVAEMVGKEHKNLIRDIRNYVEILQGSKLSSENFFIESEYLNSRNQKQPCYLLTKQGCEMVANKMTGEKGILFTAEYVQAFNKMEEHIKQPQISNFDETANEKIISFIRELPNDENKNKAIIKIIDFLTKENKKIILPRQKVEMSENAFRNLIVEFMNENDVVLKSHKQGLAIDKDALYEYMAQYGWTQHDVLKALDEYHMIYHSGEDKTQRLRLDGKIIRTLIIQ
nr:MAG TPA: regulatory protein [Caudoviricetes sp.]